jgi:hypothetical protein
MFAQHSPHTFARGGVGVVSAAVRRPDFVVCTPHAFASEGGVGGGAAAGCCRMHPPRVCERGGVGGGAATGCCRVHSPRICKRGGVSAAVSVAVRRPDVGPTPSLRVCERGGSVVAWWLDRHCRSPTRRRGCQRWRGVAAGCCRTPTYLRKQGGGSVAAWGPNIVVHTPHFCERGGCRLWGGGRTLSHTTHTRLRARGGGVAGRCRRRTLAVASEKGWGPTKKHQKTRKMKMNEYSPCNRGHRWQPCHSRTHPPLIFEREGVGCARVRVVAHLAVASERVGNDGRRATRQGR